MQLCDLHTHSNYSDGTLTPLEIIDSAINIGLKAVALTDHNTVAGIPDFLSAAKDKKRIPTKTTCRNPFFEILYERKIYNSKYNISIAYYQFKLCSVAILPYIFYFIKITIIFFFRLA